MVIPLQSLKIYQLTPPEKRHLMETITSILKHEKIIFAYLHGSFLKENFRDIDLAIYLEKNLDKKETLHLEFEIERELEKAVHFPVDVRILNHSPLSFRYNVFKEGILLFSKDELVRISIVNAT